MPPSTLIPSAMVKTNACGPIVADLLQVNRRVTRIGFHKLEAAIGKRSNIR
jgi:hypothetical protein